MTHDELIDMLRLTGCNDNTLQLVSNVFKMGVDHERDECAKVSESVAAYCQVQADKYDPAESQNAKTWVMWNDIKHGAMKTAEAIRERKKE